MIELVRRAHLFDQALVHHHHPVGKRHGFHLIMRHVDRSRAHLLVHLLDFRPHLHPQLGVEVRQGLVEQEHLRVAHDSAAHGDALALAAGKSLRLAFEQLRDIEDAGGFVDTLLDISLREPLEAQSEGHILRHRHVRIERIVLEHHGDVAVLRRDVVDDVPADQDLATGNVLESGDHSQCGRLAAAGRAYQNNEFLVGDLEVDAAHRFDLIVLLQNLAQTDIGHADQPFVAPAVSPAM